jgi:hypothetical protein
VRIPSPAPFSSWQTLGRVALSLLILLLLIFGAIQNAGV